MDVVVLLCSFVTMLLGGAFQAVSGFGSNILFLFVLSFHMPIAKIAAITPVSAIVLTFLIFRPLRAHVRWRDVLLPLPFFLISAGVSVRLGQVVDPRTMGLVLGAFLVALSLWSVCSERYGVRLGRGVLVSLAVFVASGFISGWFSLSGPLLALYFMNVTGEDKLRYVATIQAFFFLASICMTATRMANGIVTWDLAGPMAACVAGALLGQRIGFAALHRVDVAFVKRMIVAGMMAAGMATIFRYVSM